MPFNYHVILFNFLTTCEETPLRISRAIRGMIGNKLIALCPNCKFDAIDKNCLCIYKKVFDPSSLPNHIITTGNTTARQSFWMKFAEKSLDFFTFGEALNDGNKIFEIISINSKEVKAKLPPLEIYNLGIKQISLTPNVVYNNCKFMVVKIDFISPMILKRSGEVLFTPTFYDFWVILSGVVCEFMQIDKKMLDSLFVKSKDIKIDLTQLKKIKFTNYSGSNKLKYTESALAGQILLTGDLADFLPFFAVGGFLQIGKNRNLGFGDFKTTVLNPL